MPASPKNLPNERSTTMLPRRQLGGEARARRPDIHERLVDHEQAAARAQRIGEREQGVLAVEAAVGIVGIGDA